MTIDNPTPINDELLPRGRNRMLYKEIAPRPPQLYRETALQPLKSLKNKQFTGRATEKEFNRINAALAARKQPGQTYDIVRFCLDMMDHIEDDIFQTFRTK